MDAEALLTDDLAHSENVRHGARRAARLDVRRTRRARGHVGARARHRLRIEAQAMRVDAQRVVEEQAEKDSKSAPPDPTYSQIMIASQRMTPSLPIADSILALKDLEDT